MSRCVNPTYRTSNDAAIAFRVEVHPDLVLLRAFPQAVQAVLAVPVVPVQIIAGIRAHGYVVDRALVFYA
jgi:hypothetical protein